MAGSKPAALPLGYTPIKYKGAFVRQRALLYENKTACQQNKKNKFTSQNLFRTENTDNDDLPIDMYTVPPDVQNTPKVTDYVPPNTVTQSHGAMYYILLAIGFLAIIAIIGRLV